jgi:hypothetical protein
VGTASTLSSKEDFNFSSVQCDALQGEKSSKLREISAESFFLLMASELEAAIPSLTATEYQV